MKKIIFILSLLCICETLFSQSILDDWYLKRYWYYRNRFDKYFMVIGNGNGESAVITKRNRTDIFPITDRYTDINYGQHSVHLGYYWGVLATEYKLLMDAGLNSDAAKTINELYSSLVMYTYKMDMCEDYYGYTPTYDGFFIRERVECDTNTNGNLLGFLNEDLNPTNEWNGNSYSGIPLGHPAYVNHVSECNGHSAMSQDEVIGILMGCALIKKCAGNTYCASVASDIADLMVHYCLNMDEEHGNKKWRIYMPDGSPVPAGSGGSVYMYAYGLSQAACYITGNSQIHYFNATTHTIPTTLWKLMQVNNPASIEVLNFLIKMYNYLPEPIDTIAHVEKIEYNYAMQATLGAIGDSWANTANGIANSTSEFNWEPLYFLLWQVLHDKEETEFCSRFKIETDMQTAPCEGPYNFENGLFSPYWAMEYKYRGSIDEQFGTADVHGAHYNGLDYMLLHNLYRIFYKDDLLGGYYNGIHNQVNATFPVVIPTPIGGDIVFGNYEHPFESRVLNSITSNSVIKNYTSETNPSPGHVTFIAGKTIRLTSGFRVNPGAYFKAKVIKPMYCDEFVFINGYNTDSLVTDAFQKSAKKDAIADYNDATNKENSNTVNNEKKETTLKEPVSYQPSLNATNDKPSDFEYRYKIYPNPSNGRFFITFNKELNIQEILIFNAMNVVIKKITDFSKASVLVDFSQQPKGNYHIKIITCDHVFSESIILY